MLKVDRNKRTLAPLETRTLDVAGIKERYDLQQMIVASPDAFFDEMGEDLMLVGQEVRPTDIVRDRIDLLAIDTDGAAAIIEIKRGSERLQLLQAIAYAGMVAKWDAARFTAERAQFAGVSLEAAEASIADFLRDEARDLNAAQRIVLLAEAYDPEVLIGAEWLSGRFNVDIRCYRLGLSSHGEDEFLSCVCIFPPPEITDYATKRVDRGDGPTGRWKTWDEALEPVSNPAVRDFFRRVVAAGWQNNLRSRTVRAKVGGQTFAAIDVRNVLAYVWQRRRFSGDVEFWNDRIGPQVDASEVARGTRVRFYLRSAEDFRRFEELLKTDVPSQDFEVGDEGDEAGVEP